jgi:hypothetical protein
MIALARHAAEINLLYEGTFTGVSLRWVDPGNDPAVFVLDPRSLGPGLPEWKFLLELEAVQNFSSAVVWPALIVR